LFLRRFLKILQYVAIGFISLVLLVVLLLNLTSVQNYITKEVAGRLSDQLKTTVSIRHVRLDFLNQLKVEGVYIADQQNDTLLYAGSINFRITDWFIFRKDKPIIKYIGLHNAYANLYRTAKSDEWNYQFVIDGFSSSKKKPSKQEGNAIDIDLKEVDLGNVRFYMNDAWVGSDLNFEVGSFHIDADKIDLKKKKIEINNISATAARIMLRDYEGGRPPKPKSNLLKHIDTTAFNPGNYDIKLSELELDDCYFSLDHIQRDPLPGEFDPAHIRVSNINIDIDDVHIDADTLTAKLNNLSARERSGLVVKKLKADVRLSPTEAICKDLYLETNNSKLQDYYAMHYDRFPDFLDYINKVVMVVNLEQSKVDIKDIAYFAPVLREYPAVVNLSGNVKGTVADIEGQNLYLNDGLTTIKGNLTMEGLPDIEHTFIYYYDGELYTSGEGLSRYAPSLRKSEAIDISTITRAQFKGDFRGYINNFVVNGTIASNLGTIVSDVSMKMPGSTTTIFEGKMNVTDLQLGTLLRKPDLGAITLNGDVNGILEKGGNTISFESNIDKIEYRGYAYTGIVVDGKLEKEKFSGDLLIADSNISMGFYGIADFSGDLIKINAKANLLQSDLTALKLVSNDQVNLVADFDLDWEGTSIDDFTGYARLYNIDLRRNDHRLDLDSVYILATETAEGIKQMSVNSNAFTAKMEGKYQLSTLPLSMQYYIAGYVPNYIKTPDKAAPEQDINFTIITHDLDSLFGVLAPSMSGFNNATVKGNLNTVNQQLVLNADIPHGVINGISFANTSITSKGNFNTLTLDADVGRVTFPDTSMNGTIKLNTTLGGNKIAFKITTTSRNTFGDATISGQAIAYGDTLEGSFAPSEFYMNKKKWDIAGGNKIIFTDGYLAVHDLLIQSGSERISIQSENNGLQQRIVMQINGLDASEIADVSGYSEFDTKGSINGTIKADNIFTALKITSDIKATDVVLGNDTIGNINIAGYYDDNKKVVVMEPTTGIFYRDRSLTLTGKLSFDSSSSQTIDAEINMHNTHLSVLNPLLAGYVSNIRGTLDGRVTIKGVSHTPDIDGRINMSNTGVHIDFLGTDYDIPKAGIVVNNNEISLDGMTVYDRFKNTANISGGIRHKNLDKMTLNIRATSPQFEVIDLKSNESELFYGNLVAGFESLSVTGPFDNINMRITKAKPAQKSHLYLPLSTGSNELGAYSYISFKQYGDSNKTIVKKDASKLSIYIDAALTPLAEITMIMDPATGDAINAKGSGNISMEIPPNNDIRMYGNYSITEGNYTFTLPQLFFKRKFLLQNGSLIQFAGPIDNTQLSVVGIYKTKARLYDLLDSKEKALIEDLGQREATQAKIARDVDVILNMRGSLGTPELDFRIELPDQSAAGTIAYKKLELVNQNERERFNQVASLLLVNAFIPAEGNFGGGASAGVVNNISDIFSGTASSQLTNLVNKLTGNDNISINLKYQNYSFNETGATDGSATRSALSLGYSQSLFKDRLTVEVGSSVDWGKPTSSNSSSSNFNPVGDFRLQYLIKEGSNFRGNIFRTSSYDVLADQNITRGGFGLSYRKSFDSFRDLFGNTTQERKREVEQKLSDTSSSGGTQ
jgi:hypothetical protein